jgi:hypothetical protein
VNIVVEMKHQTRVRLPGGTAVSVCYMAARTRLFFHQQMNDEIETE